MDENPVENLKSGMMNSHDTVRVASYAALRHESALEYLESNVAVPSAHGLSYTCKPKRTQSCITGLVVVS